MANNLFLLSFYEPTWWTNVGNVLNTPFLMTCQFEKCQIHMRVGVTHSLLYIIHHLPRVQKASYYQFSPSFPSILNFFSHSLLITQFKPITTHLAAIMKNNAFEAIKHYRQLFTTRSTSIVGWEGYDKRWWKPTTTLELHINDLMNII